MTTRPAASPSEGYAAVLRLPYVARIVGSGLLSRSAGRMWTVALVLFVLRAFGSAPLAGAVVFVGIVPGLMLAPIAGAMLDRYGRATLAIIDFVVVATSIITIVIFHRAGVLTPLLLMLLVAAGSLTITLSTTGMRSLLPQLVKPHLWDCVNGLDAGSDQLAAILGPALGGVLVAALGPDTALVVTACVYISAAVALVGVRVTLPDREMDGLWREAADGLRYVWRNLSLRGMAIGMFIANLGLGSMVVGLPIVVIGRLHGSDTSVGLMWGLDGACAVVSGLTIGRLGTTGRERNALVAGVIVSGVALGLLGVATVPTDATVAWTICIVAIVVHGLASGPLSIGVFALRQRRTHPAWFGRAIAVSMAVNFAGYPVGSALAGQTIVGAALMTLVIAGAVAVLGGALVWRLVPSESAAAPQSTETEAAAPPEGGTAA